MPTEPNNWLSRDLRQSGADQLIEVGCPVLREVINKATIVFEDCQNSASGEPDEDLPVLMSFLHLLEMADGVEVLLSQSSVHPAKLLLRSMFEASLTVEYILRTDSRRRAFAWLVVRAHRSLSYHESLSRTTSAGQQFRSLVSGDEVQIDLDNVPERQLEDAIDNLRELLKQQNYREADAEYRRLKAKNHRAPEWFAFYDGPTTIYDLARHQEQLGTYHHLYRNWSELTHAGDGRRWLTRTSSGSPAFFALRNPQDLLFVANLAVTFLIGAMMTMLRKYEVDRNSLVRWYVEEVRERYRGLSGH